jgi:hypothetical protein
MLKKVMVPVNCGAMLHELRRKGGDRIFVFTREALQSNPNRFKVINPRAPARSEAVCIKPPANDKIELQRPPNCH